MKGRGQWANRVLDDSDIERTPEYDDFMKKLQEYHEKRGTILTPEPELGRKKLDLLKLYKKVTEAGGYDHCTTEKGVWRDLAQTYKLVANNTNAGYLLKTIYYKNLAAYEISTFHGKEPPPKELVEDRSAAGGPIMTRTFENTPPEGSPGMEPKEEEKSMSPAVANPAPVVNPGGGRTLRQAPPQRQFYQPPTTTPRASSKTATTQAQAQAQQQQQQQQQHHQQQHQQQQQQQQQQAQQSQPHQLNPNGTAPMNSQSAWTPPNTIPHYNGTSLGPIPRPVMTPANNPQGYFNQRQTAVQPQRQPKLGAGHPGAPIMMRITMGLRSGLPDEVTYALNNLVRISYEAGDGLKADDYPGMTEALVSEFSALASLSHGPSKNIDTIETPENRKRLERILEAALILRNMSINIDNARLMASLKLCRDTLVKGISIPPHSALTELKHYCLDIVEAICPIITLTEIPELFKGLVDGLDSDDRGILIASLRGLTRLVHKDETNRLKSIDHKLIRRIQDCLLLEDEELLLACLDLLYQYTAIDENVAILMLQPTALEFLKQLKRLLLHQAQDFYSEYHLRPRSKIPPSAGIPHLPPEIVNELLSFTEPERATKWMRCCFEEDPDADITQIALWQSYQSRFTEYVPKGRPLLAAADFIKNVSVAFGSASAMVIPVPPNSQKFIIKGIKPRLTPLSPKGVEYLACKWTVNPDHPLGQAPGVGRGYTTCPAMLASAGDLFSHILDVHLSPPPPGTPPQPLVCNWAECSRFPAPGCSDRRRVIAHVRTHMPDPPTLKSHPPQPNNPTQSGSNRKLLDPSDLPQNKIVLRTSRTAIDERGDAAGVALTAALVLRNIARARGGGSSIVGEMFKGGLDWECHMVAAVNQPLAQYVYDLLIERFEEEDEEERERRRAEL